MQKYAFLDRDGALINEPTPAETPAGDLPYQIDSIAKLRLLDGVIDGLQKLRDLDYKLIMVTNQDGIGSPEFTEDQFWTPHNHLLGIFQEHGIEFDQVYVCPHKEEVGCDCRKPKTGLVNNFIEQQRDQIDFENSFMYGDRLTDGEFAANIGIKFIKVETNAPFRIFEELNT